MNFLIIFIVIIFDFNACYAYSPLDLTSAELRQLDQAMQGLVSNTNSPRPKHQAKIELIESGFDLGLGKISANSI